jgi:branched-chain amino acid transport system ATP-binding protein
MLAAGYGDVRVVHGVSLEVARGSITALVGANGAGKTTLLLTLAGVVPIAAGAIRYDGHDVTRWMSHRRVDAGLVLVPEGRWVFPSLSVESNLRLGAIAPHARATWRTRLEEMYEMFPRLRERRRQAAGLLSGGEQQMLAIARGLMARPKLLLLDEPTLGLAPIMAKQVFETIETLNRGGLSILIAEQDVCHTLEICDHAYVVENGRIVIAGSGAGLIADPRVKEAYFGL